MRIAPLPPGYPAPVAPNLRISLSSLQPYEQRIKLGGYVCYLALLEWADDPTSPELTLKEFAIRYELASAYRTMALLKSLEKAGLIQIERGRGQITCLTICPLGVEVEQTGGVA